MVCAVVLCCVVLCCVVLWCGVVWCGVVWCGVVWCGVVWCGVVWCGVVVCGDGGSDGDLLAFRQLSAAALSVTVCLAYLVRLACRICVTFQLHTSRGFFACADAIVFLVSMMAISQFRLVQVLGWSVS